MANANVINSLVNRARGVTIKKRKIDQDNNVIDLEELQLVKDTCLVWLERQRRYKWSKERVATGNFNDSLGFVLMK